MSVFRRRLLQMFSAGLGKIDMVNGSVVITATGYTQGDATEETPYVGDYRIVQSSAEATENTITVNGIADGKSITLAGVNIDNPTRYEAATYVNCDVTFKLLGTNTLKMSQIQGSAIEIADNMTLTLCVPDGLSDADGVLIALGAGRYTSGIGGGDRAKVGTLEVKSGTITAKHTKETGGHFPEGTSIGTSRGTMDGIIISGGIVTAISENNSPAREMGVGNVSGNQTPILIAGGTVYSPNGFSTDLTVTGGNIISGVDLPATDISGRALTTLYFVSAGTAMANTNVTITEGEHTWSALTDDGGCVTTYLAVDGNGASNITYNGNDYTITGGSLTIEVA